MMSQALTSVKLKLPLNVTRCLFQHCRAVRDANLSCANENVIILPVTFWCECCVGKVPKITCLRPHDCFVAVLVKKLNHLLMKKSEQCTCGSVKMRRHDVQWDMSGAKACMLETLTGAVFWSYCKNAGYQFFGRMHTLRTDRDGAWRERVGGGGRGRGEGGRGGREGRGRGRGAVDGVEWGGWVVVVAGEGGRRRGWRWVAAKAASPHCVLKAST